MERVVNMLAANMNGTYKIKLGVTYSRGIKQFYFPNNSKNKTSGAAVERSVKIGGRYVTVAFPTLIPLMTSKYTGQITGGTDDDIEYITSHEWMLIDDDVQSSLGDAFHYAIYKCGDYSIDLRHDL